MAPQHEPFLIAQVAIDATDGSILTLMRMLDRAHRAGRHRHFVCSVTGLAPDAQDPWKLPAFAALCGRLVDSGFIAFLDHSTLHPPGQPEHLQAGFGALEVWMTSRGLFGAAAGVTPAILEQARVAVDAARVTASAAVRADG